jgi:exodeoxyribonuclease V alpha subunit
MAGYESNNYSVVDEDMVRAETEFETWSGMPITLDDKQHEAIVSAFENKITVITGGGGTGKSTICRCIHSIAVSRGLLVQYVAPTGAAAKVLEDKVGTKASTIHRALSLIPSSNGVVKKDPDKYFTSQVLVVDEFSMVGVDTLPHLLKGILDPAMTNLVLVGDPQQLPSVSAGNFLSAIIDSGVANVVKLDRIHRQSEKSYIPQIADDMAKGRYSGIPEDAVDIVRVPASEGNAISNSILMIVKDYLMERGNLDGLQVVSPMWAGEDGVHSLTAAIQRMVAPPGVEPLIYCGHSFYVGDRVMQIVNNYEEDIFNGNIGIVRKAGSKTSKSTGKEIKEVSVEFDHGRVIDYEGDSLKEIRVCWCCTIHKYQGSQVDELIMAVGMSHRNMMSRELVYTGITRAKERLYIVGEEAMLNLATKVSSIRKRYVNTAAMIRHGLSGEGRLSYYNLGLCSKNFMS